MAGYVRHILSDLESESLKREYLHKLQLLPATNVGVEMLAESIQEGPHVRLQVAALGQAVQRNKRRDVVTTDPQRRLQVHLQTVGF